MRKGEQMNKMVKGGMVAGGLMVGAAALVIGAGMARADTGGDLAYLSLLTQRGWNVYDVTEAVARGHQICTHMRLGASGDETAHWLYVNTPTSETPSVYQAELMVNAAANTICPDVWLTHSDPSQVV